MKPNKYNSLEFCRRTIRSCTTIKQLCNAHNLVLNFKLMFDDLFCSLLINDEWWDKYEEICEHQMVSTLKNAEIELEKLKKQITYDIQTIN